MTKSTYKIAVVLPCYKAQDTVLSVIKDIPKVASVIYCVDDGCPNETGALIEKSCKDERVQVLYNESNQGVGGAMVTGYKKALEDGADIVVKIDSDGQMDPTLLPAFIEPIMAGQADYTKGNRFYHPDFLEGMPPVRMIGNAALSFFTKLSTGYWQIFDPVNGYTAIHADALRLLPLDKISKDYFFESDILFRLGTVRAVVLDVPQKAVYGDEESHLNISRVIPVFALSHMKNFFKRIVYNYFVRDFQVASIEWVLGPLLLIFSLFFGTQQWAQSIHSGQTATAGTVMLAALPMIVGLQLTLSALHFDIQNQPKTPVHTLIKKAA